MADSATAAAEARVCVACNKPELELPAGTGLKRPASAPHPTYLDYFQLFKTERKTYEIMIDCFRMRCEDDYIWGGHNHGIYGNDPPLPAFRDFLARAKAAGMLPQWWNEEKQRECEQVAMEDNQFNINSAVEKSDIQEYYGANMMPMKLRMVAENVYGGGALSRSDKKVLHVDHNGYYGGEDTGFSLQDAEEWTAAVKAGGSTVFSDAAVTTVDASTSTQSLLKPSRAYTLSLNPQIVYAQSRFLPSLVSSQIHSQLEFQAVGSWWMYRDGKLQKIPGTREDLFNDDSLSVRDKRSLMKFLRYVLQEDDIQNEGPAEALAPSLLADALETRFKVPAALQAPIVALALSPQSAATTDLSYATTRIRRHMRSVGYFGPGFGAVLAKYGGNAEISQVACRAQAVGGGVYLLGTGLKAIHIPPKTSPDSAEPSLAKLELSDGTVIRARWVVGGVDDLPTPFDGAPQDQAIPTVSTHHTIDVVPDPLSHLFPPTAENGPVPAVAVVLVLEDAAGDGAPIYLQVHSADTGECPSGQSVIYGSVQSNQPDAVERLRSAVSKLVHLEDDPSSEKPVSIWNLSFTSHQPTVFHSSHPGLMSSPRGGVVALQTRPHDLAVQDETLDEIESIWTAILGDDAGSQAFLRFEQREQDPELGE
ncbi:hypothetical protein DV738_g1070, partial [Chaetothyriales sp. CBS 135597]